MLAAIAEAAAAAPWPGRSGSTDRAVLAALIARAAAEGALAVPASTRVIARDAGVARRQTVGAALHRLARAGWAVREEPAVRSSRLAPIWRPAIPTPRRDGKRTTDGRLKAVRRGAVTVAPPDANRTTSQATDSSLCGAVTVAVLSHDAIGHRGLSPSAGLALAALAASPGATVAEVAGVIGKRTATARDALGRLREWGVARVTRGGRWVAAEDWLARLDEGAEARGLAGRRSRRIARDQAERVAHDAAVAAWRAASRKPAAS